MRKIKDNEQPEELILYEYNRWMRKITDIMNNRGTNTLRVQ